MGRCFITPATLVMSWLVSLPENAVKLATGKVLNQSVSRYEQNMSLLLTFVKFRCAAQLPICLPLEMVSHLSKKYRVWQQAELYPLLVPMDIGLKAQD